MSWSPQQEGALRAVSDWLGSNPGRGGTPQVFRLFGYAGTGKTTLAREFAANLKGNVLFGAFTGKAAHVMGQKGCVGASTIHSMIYRLDDEKNPLAEPRFKLNRDAPVRDAALVIIDEVSMVGEELARDLLSFGTPVLVLGDPAQLPPVKDEGYFTNADPNVMLTEVHRQAEGSAIIRLATTVRTGGRLEMGEFGDAKVVDRDAIDGDAVLDADQVIVGRNRTRHQFNGRIRVLRNRSGTPQLGEKLICLRNDKPKNLLNGSMWEVSGLTKQTGRDRAANVTRLKVVPFDVGARPREVEIKVRNEFWDGTDGELAWSDRKGTEEFTFGYAITCHKSQGSQWSNVMVFDEAAAFRDDAWRWRYTAITRAADKLTVVLP